MRRVVAVLIAAALGSSSAFLVACGDRSELIPPGDARAMKSDLDRASSLHAQEECRAAQAAVGAASARAEALPPAVDADLRSRLEENLDAVLERIRTRCGRTTETQPTQPTEPPETQPTEPPETEPTEPPEPPTTTQAPEPPPATQPRQQPDPGSGGGGGSGGGSGGTPPEDASGRVNRGGPGAGGDDG